MATKKVATKVKEPGLRRVYVPIGMCVGSMFGSGFFLLFRSPICIPVGMLFGGIVGLLIGKLHDQRTRPGRVET